MKSQLKVEMNRDTLSDYLDKLDELMKTERKEMANTLMRKLVGYPFSPYDGYIAPNMSKYNPYLYSTGQNDEYWIGKSNNKLTTLEALYTGLDIHEYYGDGVPKGIWWEFATKDTSRLPPKMRKLERDYAYFQETGRDKIADSKYAKRKGGIRKGILSAEAPLHSEAVKYFGRILQLRKGLHTRTGKRSVESLFNGSGGVR